MSKHIGKFTELEDQMLHWEPGNESPDNLDAMVWVITHLALGEKKKKVSATWGKKRIR